MSAAKRFFVISWLTADWYTFLKNWLSICNIVKNVYFFQVQQSVDVVVEYLVNNTPLNWLVGPFAPQVTEKPVGDLEVDKKKDWDRHELTSLETRVVLIADGLFALKKKL